MLDVGFAQAMGKHVIYITHTHDKNPSNFGNLKRYLTYKTDDLEHLKRNLWHQISEVVESVEPQELYETEKGGRIEYFRERQKIALDEITRAGSTHHPDSHDELDDR